MSRAKRVRKARLAARRRRHAEKTLTSAHEFFDEMRERAAARAAINASDAPDALKTVFGFMVDPVGFTVDAFAKIARDPKNAHLFEKEKPE